MSSTTLQVRDVPEQVIATLRERAAAQGISLSTYIRALLADDAAQETLAEAISRIGTRAPIEANNEDILSAIREGRR